MTKLFKATSASPIYELFDAAPSSIVVVDDAGRIDFINDAAVVAFGYTRKELVGQPVETLLPAGRAERHAELREEFMVEPVSRAMGIDCDLSARRKDGSKFAAEISLIPVEKDDRIWVVATVVDVTERLEEEASLRSLNGAYLTLAQMNQAVARAPDELSLFTEACRIAVEQGGYLGAWIGRSGDGRAVHRVASAGSLDEYIDALETTTDPADPHGRGPTGRALRNGSSYFSEEFLDDEATAPWHMLAEANGIGSAATLPVRCGGEVVATFSLYSAQQHFFTPQVRSLLEGMAVNLSVALDRFDTVAQLHTVARQRAELAKRLVAAQEAERSRIAADVHDDSVQALAVLDLRLGLLSRQLAVAAPEFNDTMAEVQRTVGIISDGLRDLLFELEPAGSDSQLVDLLDAAASHVFEGFSAQCSVDIETSGWDGSRALSPTDRGQAVRIVKEALINARKHSGADRVQVRVVAGQTGIEVVVADNGSGFDVHPSSSAPGHRGLANMYDRAEVSGGSCRIESDDAGTTVRFSMPYDEWSPAELDPLH